MWVYILTFILFVPSIRRIYLHFHTIYPGTAVLQESENNENIKIDFRDPTHETCRVLVSIESYASCLLYCNFLSCCQRLQPFKVGHLSPKNWVFSPAGSKKKTFSSVVPLDSYYVIHFRRTQ